MCKTKEELNELVAQYRKFKAEQKKIEDKLAVVKDGIIEYVVAKGTKSNTNENSIVVFGDGYKVAYITVVTHPLDNKKIKELLGDDIEQYQTEKSTPKLDVR